MENVKIQGKTYQFRSCKVLHFEDYTFECFTVNGSQFGCGFIHYVEMFHNGKRVTTSVMKYWNRTRESWDYQTAVLDCIQKYMKKQDKLLKNLESKVVLYHD